MGIDRSKRITFEEVADLYQETRSRYPEEMVNAVIDLSDMPPSGKILEVGCGPGNATISFAQRGFAITAIELGQRLAAMARDKCRAYPQVQVINSAFEEWPIQERAFDLALAVDAFHWIPPEIGYPRAAATLRDGGSAVFCWRLPVDPNTEWSAAVDEVYQKIAPQFPNPAKGFSMQWLTDIITGNFAASGCFGEVTALQYDWEEQVTATHFIKSLRTFSTHHGIDEGLRERLYEEIKGVLDQFGGQITQPESVALFHARVRH